LDGISDESKREFYKEWNRENSHPDFQYSRKILEQLHIDEQRRIELVNEAFDRMNAHWNKKGYIRTRKAQRHYVCPKCGSCYDVTEPINNCIKCGSQLEESPRHLSDEEVKEFLKTVSSPELTVKTERATNTKEVITNEGDFEKRAAENNETEKPKRRRHFPTKKVVGLVIGLSLMVLAISTLVYFSPALLSHFQTPNSSSSSSSAGLGTEIKNYPLNGLSFTVTSWWFATTAEAVPIVTGITGFLYGPSSGSVYVIINFTLQNIGNTEMNLLTDENFWNLASVAPPVLQYGNYYAGATPTSFSEPPVYLGQPTDLMPNQITNCALVYQILQGYTPSRLLYPDQNSPTFVINLSG
jgi:hypothetical protein